MYNIVQKKKKMRKYVQRDLSTWRQKDLEQPLLQYQYKVKNIKSSQILVIMVYIFKFKL